LVGIADRLAVFDDAIGDQRTGPGERMSGRGMLRRESPTHLADRIAGRG